MLSGFYDLWGLLKACWIISKNAQALFLKYSLFADAWFQFNSSVLLNYKVK